MRKFYWLIPVLLFLAIGASPARADTIFNVSGTAYNQSGGTLGTCAASATCSFSGTLTIDTTAGTITGLDITFPGLSSFTTVGLSASYLTSDWTVSSELPNVFFFFNFTTGMTPGSLVGFTGGSIFGGLVTEPGVSEDLYSILSGTVTLQSAVSTPEPGTLVLLLFGLVGLLLVRKRMTRGLQPVT